MPVVYLGGEWIEAAEAPHVGTATHGGSIPPASTSAYGVRPETQPHKLTEPKADVTWEWGDAYPCRASIKTPGGNNLQCSGMMTPTGRCFRYEGRGRLWRRFVCSRCKRRATDWKVRDSLCRRLRSTP